MNSINVLLVDDHIMFAKLLTLILSEKNLHNIEIAGIASSGIEALDMLELCNVDIVLLDISMPNMDGIQVLKKISKKYPHVQVIMLTSRENQADLKLAIKNGAAGYVTKTSNYSEVLDAIEYVSRGGVHFSNISTHEEPIAAPVEKISSNTEIVSKLTRREIEIVDLISEEKTSKDIASELNISHRTVETHRKNIFFKLGVKNVAGLIKLAFEYPISH